MTARSNLAIEHAEELTTPSARRLRRGLIGLGAGGALLVVQHLLWPAPAGVVIQGALIGGLTALISLGLSLVWRANRIINFAQGDLGAFPAALAVLLIVGSGLNYFLALAAGLGVALVVGGAVEFVVIRRFVRSSRLVLTVATIGLSQVLAAAGLLLPGAFHLTVPPQDYAPPFHAAVTLGGVTFRGNDLIAMGVVPAVFVALTLFLQRTTIGTAIRACADDSDRASLLGIGVRSLQNVVWVLATLLSTLALFLRAGIVGLPIGTVLGPAVLLRALAACVIGRMDDLVVVAAAAVGLGIIEQAVVHHTGQSAYVDPVLFVVILAALLLDRRRTDRGRAGADPSGGFATRENRPVPRALRGLPEIAWARRGLAVAVSLVLVGLPLVLPESRINLVAAGVIYAIIGLSLVVLTGWAGQVSLGQMAFVGIGAAVGGWITASAGWDLTVAVVVAGLAGAAAAVVIGLPALRLGGLELAVTTLAFALATSSYLLNPKYLHWLPTARVARHPVLGFLSVGSETRFYELTLVALALAVLAARGVRSSRTGRVLIASRENRRAAEGYGVPTTRATLSGFAMSGFLAAAAGALFVHHQQSLGTSAYAPAESLVAFTMVVVGGLGSVPGALLGAAYVRGADWFLPFRYRILATGAGLLGVLLVLPDGLGSLLWQVRDRWLAGVARRHGLAVVAEPLPPGGPPGDGPPMAVRPAGEVGEAGGGRAGPAAVLAVHGIHAGYGRSEILAGADLRVGAGEVVALVGTNGAGKSTLLRVVSGLLRPRRGTVTLDGRDITRAAPNHIAAAGVAHLPGGRGVFPSLSVADNLRLARWQARRHGTFDAGAMGRLASTFPVLVERAHDRAGDLSGGQQQQLALAMVLAARPRLVLLDELSLGLAPTALARLLPMVTALRDQGAAVLIVEQSIPVALAVSDRAYVMERGAMRWAGPAAELAEHPDLLRSVFLAGAGPARAAGPVAAPLPGGGARPAPPGPRPRLAVNEVSLHFGGVAALDHVSFELAEGEILGVIGANGAGKTTLFDVISGHADATGTVWLDGVEITHLPPHERARLGLGRSFQDSRLFPGLTVAETLAVALELHLHVRDPVAAALHLRPVRQTERWVSDRVDQLLATVGLTDVADRSIDEVSTGTRRIVDLACLLAQQPRVILLDEPSAGIAQREAEALGPLLRRIRDDQGASLVVIEHDLAFLGGVAERLVAVDLGRVIAEGSPDRVLRDPAVVAAYLGDADATGRWATIPAELR